MKVINTDARPVEEQRVRLTEHDARAALDTILAAHEADADRLPAPTPRSRFSREETCWSPSRARYAGQDWRAERYLAGNWPSVSTVLRRFDTFGGRGTGRWARASSSRPPHQGPRRLSKRADWHAA
jgi:hypothetical protein